MQNLHLILTVCTVVKSKVKISQNCMAFSEYMNFTVCLEAHVGFLELLMKGIFGPYVL